MKKGFRFLTVLLGLVVVALVGSRYFLNIRHEHHRNVPVEGEGFGHVVDFLFTDQEGTAFGLDNLKGNVWITNFIFTRCAGPCPVMSTKMARLQTEFENIEKLKFVSFSVDPEYDTPGVLAKYADRYGALAGRWHFLTGKKDKIYDLIRKNFHLAIEGGTHSEHDNMKILHSLHFVLIDKKGEIKGYFNSKDAESLNDLRALIPHLAAKA